MLSEKNWGTSPQLSGRLPVFLALSSVATSMAEEEGDGKAEEPERQKKRAEDDTPIAQ